MTFLKITALSKTFGGTRALDRVDWDVAPGEVHCLVGENGCGKSTLIKIVAASTPPIRAGCTLLGIAAKLRAAGIAVVFVSHKLDEVAKIADRVTVMRDGRKLGTFKASEIDQARIGELMTGRNFSRGVKQPMPAGAPALEARETIYG